MCKASDPTLPKLLFHTTTNILCKVTPTTGHLHSTCFTFRFDGYDTDTRYAKCNVCGGIVVDEK